MDLLQHIRWRPGIGDPTFMGWLTVAAYAAAAFVAWYAGRMAGTPGAARTAVDRRRLWFAVALIMTLLCINKQLDLQSLLTDLGRALFKQFGWYEKRRGFQLLFTLGLLAAALGFTAWTAWRFRVFWREHPLLAGGLIFLVTFVVVRAVSFHHFEEFLGFRIAGLRMNWVLELTGISLVALAGLREISFQSSERT